MFKSDTDETDEVSGGLSDDDAKLLDLAQKSFRTSTSFIDSSYRKQWEKNLAAFNNKHASGSKYYSEAYKYRSKVYRPKVRTTIRRNEAAAAVAFFSTADAIHVAAENEGHEVQRLVAKINHALMNYRLEQTIKWFTTVIGAYQDCHTNGFVISKQWWEFRTVKYKRTLPRVTDDGQVIIDEEGRPAYAEAEVEEVVADRPHVTLLPMENVRIDPAADWIDPMNSSPYVIIMTPMYVTDVKDAMKDDTTGKRKPWRQLTDEQLRNGRNQDYDSLRTARNGSGKEDPKSAATTDKLYDHDIVWVHENFMRVDGKDIVYHTLGTQHVLSDPQPIHDAYWHCADGERPLVLGKSNIEAHKVYPAGTPELLEGLVQESNELANSRLDNIKLVLNKRYIARKGAKINWRSLMHNVPGSVTTATDIKNDIREMQFNDITGSSFEEQNRINADIDDLSGSFSMGSVQTNRALNETVGGMNLMSGDSDKVTDYQLRAFTETWVEPVLRQLVLMEQRYETDETILDVVGQRLKLEEKYGIKKITDRMLQGQMLVRVNVGFGSTQPEKRIAKLRVGLDTIAAYFPDMVMQSDRKEIISEIFGALGYDDGRRFFPTLADDQNGEDPRIAQLEQELQKMQQMLQTKMAEKQIDSETKLQLEQMKQEGHDKDRQADIALGAMNIKGRSNEMLQKIKADLGKNAMNLNTQRQMFANEVAVKQNMGPEGNYGLESEV